MAQQDLGGFTQQEKGGGVALITVRPARASLAFLAATGLLGALFGLPALAVLLDPRRHDAISLAAALCALLILTGAVIAFRRARRGRGERRIRLAPEGITLPERHVPWSVVRELRAEQPAAARQPATGVYGLAANVAAQQRAAEARLLLDTVESTEPLLVAEGLGIAVAERLRDAILRRRP
ncbi:hypothetical protein E0493_19855 [Roseomonas sp. M0104]|uniref:Uncharacterized protein n=1 Tax=Teichococcus coralli TaxID=2545983 RepID=A0A845BJZ2_9PROT|nr:hypothetical protein [Pseudoroseomonas coralli]MXP65607.1 hypothetical protein [Pseudoroseomonas coralli]